MNSSDLIELFGGWDISPPCLAGAPAMNQGGQEIGAVAVKQSSFTNWARFY